MAIITRCCCPPESWWGKKSKRCSGSGMPTSRNKVTTRSRSAAPRSRVCSCRVSATCLPTVCTGFNALMAFWKIIATRRPRTSCMRASDRPKRSCPATSTLPPLIRRASGSRRMAARDVTDLPLPDSPTRANTLPACNSKLTPLTMAAPVSASVTVRSRTCRHRVPGAGRLCCASLMLLPSAGWCGGQRHRAPGRKTGWRQARE